MPRGATPPSKAAASPLLAPRPRLKKTQSSQKINTNPSAHPRTDPINALNVLLKLLTSLPSRIGGCQYKLTQAEHALSLHLVSVLDPYVYRGVRALAPNTASSTPAAPCLGLVDQPTEIIDAILAHVDARRDLLHIGLVCKRLHGVVFPRHFEYRTIRCKVSSIGVWNHLALHRSLSRNVRVVEIMDERAPAGAALVPRGILLGDTDLESTDDELTMHAKQERFLAKALVRMTGLREFKWACNHSPLSIAHLWPTLMVRAANLRSINICDNLVFSPRMDQEESESEGEGEQSAGQQSLMSKVPDVALMDMESVTFRSTPHSYGSSKTPELARIAAMLHQCVNLKDLDVTYIAPRSSAGAGGQSSPARTRPLADEFLIYGRWSKLTTLTLANLRAGSYLPAASFLAAHPALEVLHLDITTAPAAAPLSLAPGSLPRLRDIKASKELLNVILACPCDSPRPLEAVRGFRLAGSASVPGAASPRSVPDAVLLANLRAHAAGIRRVELAGWAEMEDIRRLAQCVPRVQHLDIGRRLGAGPGPGTSAGAVGHRAGGAAPPVGNVIEWMEVLATLPELVALHGVKFFYEVAGSGAAGMSMMERSRMRKNDEVAGVLTWKCPRLRRVDHWDEGGARVIVLLREGADDAAREREGGARWEVRRARQGLGV